MAGTLPENQLWGRRILVVGVLCLIVSNLFIWTMSDERLRAVEGIRAKYFLTLAAFGFIIWAGALLYWTTFLRSPLVLAGKLTFALGLLLLGTVVVSTFGVKMPRSVGLEGSKVVLQFGDTYADGWLYFYNGALFLVMLATYCFFYRNRDLYGISEIRD